MRILNKFLSVKKAEEGKELWKLLDENIIKIISENFGEDDSKKTKKDKKEKKAQTIEELEAQLA